MNQTLCTSLVLSAALSGLATAQSSSAEAGAGGIRPKMDQQLSQWREAHGSSWRAVTDRETGTLEMLYGGSAEAPFRPEIDQDWFVLGRNFMQASQAMHQIGGGTLVDDKVTFLPLGQMNTTDKMSVRYRQEIAGIPVIDGWVNALFSVDGDLLSLQNTSLRLPEGASTTPALSPEAAQRLANETFTRTHTVAIRNTEAAELAFVRVAGMARLAWRVEVRGTDDRMAKRYVVDAQNGQLLDTEELVHHFDVGGTVSTNATSGIFPDSATNPEVVRPLPLARVSSSAGTVLPDENGNFNFPGVNSPLQVTIEYIGQFYEVRNSAGAEHTVTTTAQVGQGNNLLLNPSSVDTITGAANAYIGSHETRELVVDTNPGDTTANFNIISNVNLNSTCNAFFNGVSINFYPAGGGCVNTSYSTVVAHELGHWLNVLYGTGNGADGMGEGNADVFAMYTYDVPIVGRNFSGPGGNIRTGNNTRQFCGDANAGCHGGVHANGEVWMGAAWKVRRNLNTTHGNAVGDMISNNLFLGWLNGFNQTTIRTTIETQWLTLDDDDGNIDNGTPNYSDIDSAFREQGFPGVDLALISFSGLTQVDNTEDDSTANTVDVTVSANFGTTITDVTLNYSVNGGSDNTVSMVNVGGDNWTADIPAIPSPASIEYFVEAVDDAANVQIFPEAGSRPSFVVGVLTPILVTDFNQALGDDEGWTVGLPGDGATTGIWERVNPVGTEAQPEDDNTAGNGGRAWITGQGSVGGAIGENDVDGGVTTLLSPVFDASMTPVVPISYWRWYSNDAGGSPNADVFQVDVSNNGGTTWTNVETVGPAGAGTAGGWINHTANLGAFVNPTANMRLRFRASDLGDGSIVEAGIDDVEFSVVVASDFCTPATNYCVASPHSASGGGQGALVNITGSQIVADNNITLEVNNAPGDRFGLFFFGPTQVQVTFGDGFRCVGGATRRLPLVQTDVFGFASSTPDLTNLPTITAGSTQNFQFWFRDPMGPGGTGFNTSNGISVPFCE